MCISTTPSSMDSTISPVDSSLEQSVKNMSYTPPWTTPYIIGIGGPSGSGKTSVASKIVSALNVPWTVLISMDNFYKPLTAEERNMAFDNNYDFDTPNALDQDLAYQCIANLKDGKKVDIPVYSFVNHNRVPDKFVTIYGARVIIFEGIYALHDPRLLDLMDIKIFVDADLDVCLARRLSRDIVSRGRDLKGCIDQWERFVKPNAVKYVRPTMNNADAIIPSMSNNDIAIKLVVDHIKSKLNEKSKKHLQELIKLGYPTSESTLNNSSVHILERTNQVKAIMTMIVDKNLHVDDFVFYFDRIATILLNKVLDDLPIKQLTDIITACGNEMKQVPQIDFDEVTAINLIRSGDCFIHSLRKTLPNVTIGKLLIQSDLATGEPQLHCEFLPTDVDKYRKVLLMEAQVINGTSMIMAIQVLLDHNVKLENINIVCYSATEIGIRRILNAFNENIKIYIGAVVTRKEIDNQQNQWVLTRFIDAKYFGCK